MRYTITEWSTYLHPNSQWERVELQNENFILKSIWSHGQKNCSLSLSHFFSLTLSHSLCGFHSLLHNTQAKGLYSVGKNREPKSNLLRSYSASQIICSIKMKIDRTYDMSIRLINSKMPFQIFNEQRNSWPPDDVQIILLTNASERPILSQNICSLHTAMKSITVVIHWVFCAFSNACYLLCLLLFPASLYSPARFPKMKRDLTCMSVWY